MKTVKLLWVALIALTLSAYGQMDRIYGPTTINSAQAFLKISGDGYATAGFQITGTWSGTITFESTIDDSTWVAVSATNRASGATGSTTTANGVFNIPSTGVRSVRARMSSYTSGSALITPILSPASLSSAAGGGAGDASAANQTSGSQKTQIVDGAGNVIGATSNALDVNIKSGAGSGGTAMADDAAFTPATTSVTPIAGFADETTPDAVDEGDAGAVRMTLQRGLHVNLRNASGTELGVSAAPVRVDPTGTTTQPVSYATTGSGTATGAIRVELPTNGTGTVGLNAGSNVIGSLTANQSVNVAQINGVTPLMGTGASGTGSHRVTIATDGQGQVADNAGFTDGTTRVDMQGYIFDEVAGTALTENDGGAGRMDSKRAIVHVIEDATTRGQRAAVSSAGALAANLAQVAGASVATGSGTAAGSIRVELPTNGTGVLATVGAVTSITNTVAVGGVAAHDAAVSGNPVLTGIEARTSNGTAVANGDVTRIQGTIDGKLVTKPHSVYGATWTYAAASGGITNTTAATIKAAAGAGIRNCLTGIQVINGHASVSTEVSVRDGAAGTVVHRGYAVSGGGGYSTNFDVPICGTANTLMEVVAATTGSAIYVNAQGYTTAE